MTSPGSLKPLGGALLEPVMGNGGWQELWPWEGGVTGRGEPWPHPSAPHPPQRLSLVRDKCFLSATECLQKIM